MAGDEERAARTEDLLPLPLQQEATQQQAIGNATQHDYPRDMCVPQLVAAQAAATPNATALVAGGHTLTYGELNQRANTVAHTLQALGVGPDVPVCICVERSLSMVVALLGTLKAGGAYIPLDPAWPPERLGFMLNDAQAPVLVTQQRVAARLPAPRAHVVLLDVEAALATQSAANPPSAARANNLAYVIYTSGSTGQPKGVEITHDSLLNLVFWHRRAFTVTAADRATQLAGPAFDATVWELWPYLVAGASVYLPDEETRVAPRLLRDWLVAHGITISFVPTALAEGLMALDWPPTTALRILLTGADTLHHYPSPLLPFALINNYGPTECTVVATSGLVPPTMPATGATPPRARSAGEAQARPEASGRAHVSGPEQPPSIGRPIANTEVYILDAQRQPVSVGEPGELYIGGACLARGYRNRPELTVERFIPHPFSAEPGARLYRTGDRACYLPDGQIAFLGRFDDQIKIRGYRIEPQEITTALNAHPAVQTSLVVAREDTPGERCLVAYVVLAPGAPPTASALRDFLGTQLPDYMVPAAFVRLEALPLTPNGKVDRAALPAPEAANTLRDEAYVAPRSPLEERLAAIVAPLLGLEQVGVDDNFFLLGGHSLLGTQVIARVSDTFGVDLSLRSLFDAPTVAELALEVERLILAKLEAMSDEEAQRLLA
jgi:amino acid adenylation domain-containing protein